MNFRKVKKVLFTLACSTLIFSSVQANTIASESSTSLPTSVIKLLENPALSVDSNTLSELENISINIGSSNSNTGEVATLNLTDDMPVYIEKINENEDYETYELTTIVTLQENASIENPNSRLNGYQEDELADVTYYVQVTYTKKSTPDLVTYCYNISKISGGVISSSDPQMTGKELKFTKTSQGSWYENGVGDRNVGVELETLATISYPKTGSTYSATSQSNKYFEADDYASGTAGRAVLTVKRTVSSYETTDFVEVVFGQPLV